MRVLTHAAISFVAILAITSTLGAQVPVPAAKTAVHAKQVKRLLIRNAMVIPGNGLLLIRSFAEHRARPQVRERIAIVEASWILGPLFLFNNLHALHHAEPKVPWYRLPALYRQRRAHLLVENGGLVYVTYFDVARRFMFRAHDVLPHPTGRVPALRHGASRSPA